MGIVAPALEGGSGVDDGARVVIPADKRGDLYQIDRDDGGRAVVQ